MCTHWPNDFAEINTVIDKYNKLPQPQQVSIRRNSKEPLNERKNFMMSSDLKSYWLLTDKNFTTIHSKFCPYCEVTKGDCEDVLRGRLTPNDFCFCWLHCKIRITETLLRHQIRAYHSLSTKGRVVRLQEWEDLLQQLTNSKLIKVKTPKKQDDRNDWGKVCGLTGGMVEAIVNGSKAFENLSPPSCSAHIQEVWELWKKIISFVEKESIPTEAFKELLKSFGERLLDTYEWKIITAYTHILVSHSPEVMARFGNICKHSQEGLEGANKLHKRIAERASSHTKQKSIKQQFFHIYRLVWAVKN